jgi:transposase
MISAISYDRIVANQIVEGGVDSVLFENFFYQTMVSVLNDKDMSQKQIVVLLDNAVIHRHAKVLDTARKLRVHVLFNAEYSPWLNPIEELFRLIKKKLHQSDVDTK